MNENASIKINTGSRSPAVTFKAQGGQLVIRVAKSSEEAKAIAGKAAVKTRAKAKASRAILRALDDLLDEETRDRSGFLQGDVPAKLRTELGELAKAGGKTLTALFLDLIDEWVDPNTGRPRLKRRANGSTYDKWPGIRRYVGEAGPVHNEAKTAKTLSRLQVEVGPKVVAAVEGRLIGSRVSKGLFLTAAGLDIIERHKAE
ncbi:hypothetical protein K9U39_18035 [Rhodoblastus acidophilus]|uniref:Uncharacterized protein n=1 Tax=Candidatus Rhodoblastus alkanivorans TaxID=2954117 RepID=A0ABS9Z2A8_9HYPH|nr:hypothetical protein [Candidatus Rhodoblastus alkanivorans]MCI4680591.1 hypothetical protein [Candidatus Rhodoblastus alkanivorans]MCI4681763.1 hypothetical protein [Candidatus Rhodoblastus alkanivorans]MDI4642812.1 hypothetical protein [Rhodoblastus acidophilus]